MRRKKENEGAWTYYRREDGLIGDNVGAIFVEAQGNVWFTHSDGVAILDAGRRKDRLHPIRLRLRQERQRSTLRPSQPPHRPIGIADQVEFAGRILGEAADVETALELQPSAFVKSQR